MCIWLQNSFRLSKSVEMFRYDSNNMTVVFWTYLQCNYNLRRWKAVEVDHHWPLRLLQTARYFASNATFTMIKWMDARAVHSPQASKKSWRSFAIPVALFPLVSKLKTNSKQPIQSQQTKLSFNKSTISFCSVRLGSLGKLTSFMSRVYHLPLFMHFILSLKYLICFKVYWSFTPVENGSFNT